jgi:hypothetical protein
MLESFNVNLNFSGPVIVEKKKYLQDFTAASEGL